MLETEKVVLYQKDVGRRQLIDAYRCTRAELVAFVLSGGELKSIWAVIDDVVYYSTPSGEFIREPLLTAEGDRILDRIVRVF